MDLYCFQNKPSHNQTGNRFRPYVVIIRCSIFNTVGQEQLQDFFLFGKVLGCHDYGKDFIYKLGKNPKKVGRTLGEDLMVTI